MAAPSVPAPRRPVGAEVAVHVPGLSRPLYGHVVELTGETCTVRVEGDRGRATMLGVPWDWLVSWRPRVRSS